MAGMAVIGLGIRLCASTSFCAISHDLFGFGLTALISSLFGSQSRFLPAEQLILRPQAASSRAGSRSGSK